MNPAFGPPSKTTSLAPWRHVWRVGISPFLRTQGLTSLQIALDYCDPRLTHLAAIRPHPIEDNLLLEVEAADPVAWCGWALGHRTVGDLWTYHNSIRTLCIERCGPLVCGPARNAFDVFLAAWDQGCRERMELALLGEVELALARRTNPSPDSIT